MRGHQERAMPWEVFIAPFRVAALEHELARQHYSAPAQGGRARVYGAVKFTWTAAADLLGVHPGSLSRWDRVGWVPLRSVEDVAEHLCRHPMDLWGDEYLAAVDKSSAVRKQESMAASG